MPKNNSNYGTYLAKIMNLKQIFSKLSNIWNEDGLELNIDNFVNEVESIEKEVRNLEKTGDEVPYQLYCSRLDYIENEINKQYGPLYKIYKYTIRINSLVNNINEDNINDVANVTKELIYIIADLKVFGNVYEDVLNQAYRAIYNVIKHEAVIDKSITLDYLVSKNNDSIREHLGQLLAEDLKLLPSGVVADLELRHSDEGLGYDFLSSDAVKMIGLLSLQDKNDEYLKRKKSATAIILEKADEIAREKKKINKKNDGINKEEMSKIRGNMAKAYAKLLALILIPIISTYGMSLLGGLIKKKYKTTTLDYNLLNKNNTIEEKESYSDYEYQYQINIKKYSPWRENPDGGYIRDVIEYDYKDTESNTKVNPEELMKSLRDRSVYPEFKDVLNEEDNTTEEEIIVNEIIQDRTDAIGHPLTVSAASIFWVIVVALVLYGLHDDGYWSYPDNFKEAFTDSLDYSKMYFEKRKGRITRTTIRESFSKIGDKAVKLQEEIANATYKYGDLSEEINPEIIKEVKTYTKKM